jgi:glucose dehydrogenase
MQNTIPRKEPSMGNQRSDSNQEQVHAGMSRRGALKAGAALVATPFLGRVTSMMQVAEAASTRLPVDRPEQAHARKVRGSTTEWSNYSGDKASSKYSPLDQIGGDNFKRLKVAWTWRSVEEEVAKANHLKAWAWEATPLMVGGVLYVSTSLSQVAAIDAATGKTRWVYDPETWKNDASCSVPATAT